MEPMAAMAAAILKDASHGLRRAGIRLIQRDDGMMGSWPPKSFRGTWFLSLVWGHLVATAISSPVRCSEFPAIVGDRKLTRTDRPPSGLGSAVMEAP